MKKSRSLNKITTLQTGCRDVDRKWVNWFVDAVVNDSEPWSPDDSMDAMSHSSSGYVSPLNRDLLRGQRQLQEAGESEDELQQDVMVEPDAALVLRILPPLHSLR